MEDKEFKRKENLHKTVKSIQLFSLVPIMFCIINVSMHYIFLAIKDIKGTCDWEFKIEYLYTESKLMPIKTVIIISFLIAILIVMRLDENWRVKHGAENLKSDDRYY